jgi:hypothetical protein
VIGLLSCSAQKLDRAAPARELYCSPLFRKSLAYAERRCKRVYVLSALHHLVELDQVLEPYERRLDSTKREREIWGTITASALEPHARRAGHDLLILAGADYVRPLLRVVAPWWRDGSWRKHIHLPLAGMQVGERLRWLNDQSSKCAAPDGRSHCILDAEHQTHHSDGWRTWR